MVVRKISYQAMDGKWYDLQVADLIDPLDNLPKTKELIKDIQDGKLVLVVGEDYKNHEAENEISKDKSITEHPDVQRLIRQVVKLQAELKAIEEERRNIKHWVNYHNISIRNVQLEAEIAKQYKRGYEDGLKAYAWWKDGVQYVGSCGTTLAEALKEGESDDNQTIT